MPGIVNHTEWTLDSLHEYLVSVLKERDDRHKSELIALEKTLLTHIEAAAESAGILSTANAAAIQKADENIDRRFEILRQDTLAHAQSDVVAHSKISSEFHETVNSEVAHLKTTIDVILSANEKAIAKADAANEKRFDSVNEIRGTMADQATKFISRTEVGQMVKNVEDKTMANVSRLDRIESAKSGRMEGWQLLVAALGAVGVLIGIISGIALLLHTFVASTVPSTIPK
jgi:hypothetical protein